jgi:hypothetical protein
VAGQVLRLLSIAILAVVSVLAPGAIARAYDVVLNAQGEYLDAYLMNGSPVPPRVVLIDPDPPEPDNPAGPPARVGRHVNGKLCFFPPGFGHGAKFVMADDTYREACVDRHVPQARCSITRRSNRQYVGKDADGWGVFKRSGRWTKRHIHVAGELTEPQAQGTIDPQGCAFDTKGNFFGVDVGHGSLFERDGSLLMFFPGRKKRYDTYCFLHKALAAPSMPVFDDAGNLYVPETALFRVLKFSPPFPTSAADCDNPEKLVTTPPTRTVFLPPQTDLLTPSGIARVPGSDHFYIGSVLLVSPIINEYDAMGTRVRNIVPADVPRNPLGMDVGSDGTIYYAELNLDPVTNDTRCGFVSMVRFDGSGQPMAPVTLGQHLRFPDGVTVVDSSRFNVDFTRLPPSPDIDPSRCGGE